MHFDVAKNRAAMCSTGSSTDRLSCALHLVSDMEYTGIVEALILTILTAFLCGRDCILSSVGQKVVRLSRVQRQHCSGSSLYWMSQVAKAHGRCSKLGSCSGYPQQFQKQSLVGLGTRPKPCPAMALHARSSLDLDGAKEVSKPLSSWGSSRRTECQMGPCACCGSSPHFSAPGCGWRFGMCSKSNSFSCSLRSVAVSGPDCPWEETDLDVVTVSHPCSSWSCSPHVHSQAASPLLANVVEWCVVAWWVGGWVVGACQHPPPQELPSDPHSPKFRACFPLPLPFSFFFSLCGSSFFFLSGGLLVEFWWCLKRRGPSNVHVGSSRAAV